MDTKEIIDALTLTEWKNLLNNDWLENSYSSSELPSTGLICRHDVDEYYQIAVNENQIYMCKECLTNLRIGIFRRMNDLRIKASLEIGINPKLQFFVIEDDPDTDHGFDFGYTYTGSLFNEYDLVYIGNTCPGELFMVTADSDYTFDGDSCVIESDQYVTQSDESEKTRILLKKIDFPKHHPFFGITDRGIEDKVKLIRMFVADKNNKLPGEVGYIENKFDMMTIDEIWKSDKDSNQVNN